MLLPSRRVRATNCLPPFSLTSNCNEARPLVHSKHAARFDGQGFELRGKVTRQLQKATILSVFLFLHVVEYVMAPRSCIVAESCILVSRLVWTLHPSADPGLDSCIPVTSPVWSPEFYWQARFGLPHSSVEPCLDSYILVPCPVWTPTF